MKHRSKKERKGTEEKWREIEQKKERERERDRGRIRINEKK